MAASPPLVPASRARRRVKGKWSGAEAKFQFLSSHMCDAGLEARVEQLKAASHWWPWLTCNRDQHSDGGVTYTCPTYVLYDALSVDGRGEKRVGAEYCLRFAGRGIFHIRRVRHGLPEVSGGTTREDKKTKTAKAARSRAAL
eukprot:349632-Chlamydomonas_euryale.AAC.39